MIADIIPQISFLLFTLILTITADINTEIAAENITNICKTDTDKTFFITTKENADNSAKNMIRAKKYENINKTVVLNSLFDLTFFLATTLILGIKKSLHIC